MSKEFKKCSAKMNGYAQNICKNLKGAMQSSGKGIVGGVMTDIKTGRLNGTRVMVKSGMWSKDGVVMNVCPFCAGSLHDIND